MSDRVGAHIGAQYTTNPIPFGVVKTYGPVAAPAGSTLVRIYGSWSAWAVVSANNYDVIQPISYEINAVISGFGLAAPRTIYTRRGFVHQEQVATYDVPTAQRIYTCAFSSGTFDESSWTERCSFGGPGTAGGALTYTMALGTTYATPANASFMNFYGYGIILLP